MNENLIPIIAIILIIFGWFFYFKIMRTEVQTNFKNDDFGEYFVEDIKKLIGHLDKMPKKIQINVYENILLWYGKFSKEVWKLEVHRGQAYKKIFKKYIEEAARIRRENITEEGYNNPKWLSVAIYETLLFSNSKKMSFDNGQKIRKYIFSKMKKILPNNKNLNLFLKVDS